MRLLRPLVSLMIVLLVSWLTSGSTTYRGVNVTLAGVGPNEIYRLADTWNANIVRIRLAAHDECDYSIVEILDPATSADPILLELDRVIEACQTNGIRVVLDIHQFPGYSTYDQSAKDFRLWHDAELQDRFIRYWRGIAQRYAHLDGVIYGYDLLNEPIYPSLGAWIDLANRTAEAIRKVDFHSAIIVESKGGSAAAFSEMVPIDDNNVICSVHPWNPQPVAMQGALGHPTGTTYPNDVWNKDHLRDVLKPVVEFQRRYGVRIFAGEFGTTAQSPADTRVRYLDDLLSVFEEYGFDYAFASYRKYPTYSLEHAAYVASYAVVPMYVETTDALAKLQEYLALNVGSPTPQLRDRPICLFDTSHWLVGEESNVFSLDYAWRLTGSCDVVYHNAEELTSDVLSGVSLLVTGNSHGRDYEAHEIATIVDFVRAGGALLYYGGTASSTSINQLLEPFGIQHDPTPIFSLVPAIPGDVGDSFWTEPMGQPVPGTCSDCSFLARSYVGSYSLDSGATPLATSRSDTWKDANHNADFDEGETEGPFVVIAASELGEGRVIAVADKGLRDVCNWMVLRGAVDWLLANGRYETLFDNPVWSTELPTIPHADETFAGFFPPACASEREAAPVIRILFDEGHHEYDTISFERAIELNPTSPQNHSYGLLAAGLGVSHVVDRTVLPLTPELLNNHDVLVIANPRLHFASSERAAVERFVQEGGGLFVLAAGRKSSLNELLSPMGVEFSGSNVLTFSSTADIHSPEVSTIESFPGATAPVTSLVLDYATSLEPSPSLEAVVWSSAETWLDLDDDEIQDAEEPTGPLIIAGTAEYGLGRIVAMADSNAFVNYSIAYVPGNCSFFLNAIEWLFSPSQIVENWLRSASGGRVALDDFEVDDNLTHVSSKWNDYTWGGGRYLSPPSVERDESGGYLVMKESGFGGGVGISCSLWGADLSDYDGVYIQYTASSHLSLGLNLLSLDEEWGTGEVDTYCVHQLSGGSTPTETRIPFTCFAVETWRRAQCPGCSTTVDQSRFTHLGIEIMDWSGELRIYELGFYRD
ncbi:cellulase family glycosylhydrolase [Candidatus Bipolaricaulota bacterium]